MSEAPADVLVLGAGIAGASLAAHLARARFGRIVVADPRTPAGGATGRAAGIVTEQLWDRWDLEVVRETMVEYAALAARHDRSAYRVNGFVRWTHQPEVARILEATRDRLRAWGVEVRDVGPAEVDRLLPWARTDDLAGAALAPKDAVVAPSRMAELLLEEAGRLGVRCAFGAPVGALSFEDGHWQARVQGTIVRARRAVVAAGAWSKALLRDAGAPLPLVPYRTQAALVRPPGPPAEEFPSFHDIDLDVYGRPEEAGRVLVGNGTESREADPERFAAGGDERFLGHVAESFEVRLPGWKDAELVRAWAGVCVATPDRHPLIGPVPGAAGLYAITGFNGFGVMRAPGAAGRLARAIADPSAEEKLLGPVLPSRLRPPYPAFTPKPGFTLEAGPEPRW